METKVRALFEAKRSMEAESGYLHGKLRNALCPADARDQAQMRKIDGQLLLVQNWFLLLKEDEAFVTQRHLVDGIDWPRIALEYKARWGDNYEKTERTLKNYQQRALRKIVAFTKAHPETLDIVNQLEKQVVFAIFLPFGYVVVARRSCRLRLAPTPCQRTKILAKPKLFSKLVDYRYCG